MIYLAGFDMLTYQINAKEMFTLEVKVKLQGEALLYQEAWIQTMIT